MGFQKNYALSLYWIYKRLLMLQNQLFMISLTSVEVQVLNLDEQRYLEVFLKPKRLNNLNAFADKRLSTCRKIVTILTLDLFASVSYSLYVFRMLRGFKPPLRHSPITCLSL